MIKKNVNKVNYFDFLIKDLLMDAIISQAVLEEKKKSVLLKIDEALDQKDRAAFDRLCNEYKELNY